MNYLAKLKELESRLDAANEDDFPLGKATHRREAVVRLAVDVVTEIVIEGSDGSNEDTNYIAAQVALRLVQAALSPFGSVILAKDIKERHDKRCP